MVNKAFLQRYCLSEAEVLGQSCAWCITANLPFTHVRAATAFGPKKTHPAKKCRALPEKSS